jgi:hypothetical protein
LAQTKSPEQFENGLRHLCESGAFCNLTERNYGTDGHVSDFLKKAVQETASQP